MTVPTEKYATETNALNCLHLVTTMGIVLQTNTVITAIVQTADTTFSAPLESIVGGTDALRLHVAKI